jgi:hypothetical protein
VFISADYKCGEAAPRHILSEDINSLNDQTDWGRR